MQRPSRMRLTDKSVRSLPFADEGQYSVADTELPGFVFVVGKRAKTYTARAEVQTLGRRRSLRKALGRFGEITTREARSRALRWKVDISNGSARPTTGVTLRQAWDRYRESHLERQGRSPRTIDDYRASLERLLVDWLDIPLARLSEDAALVADRHDEITQRHGPASANHAMRALRAVYRYARKRMDRTLPPEHPASAVDFNPEFRRDTALLPEEFPRWWAQLHALPNPIRREFHLFCLLSGSRPGALSRAQWEHLDGEARTLHFPDPKGGPSRAFDIPAKLRDAHVPPPSQEGRTTDPLAAREEMDLPRAVSHWSPRFLE